VLGLNKDVKVGSEESELTGDVVAVSSPRCERESRIYWTSRKMMMSIKRAQYTNFASVRTTGNTAFKYGLVAFGFDGVK